jgi:hypothetical protein
MRNTATVQPLAAFSMANSAIAFHFMRALLGALLKHHDKASHALCFFLFDPTARSATGMTHVQRLLHTCNQSANDIGP